MSSLWDNYYASRGGFINPTEVQNAAGGNNTTTGDGMLPFAIIGGAAALGSAGAGIYQGYKQDQNEDEALAYKKQMDAIALRRQAEQDAQARQDYIRKLLERSATSEHWATQYNPGT